MVGDVIISNNLCKGEHVDVESKLRKLEELHIAVETVMFNGVWQMGLV